MQEKRVWVDPPSGWQYGFPAIWDKEEGTLEELLTKHKYPQKDMSFALSYMRMWNVNEDDEQKHS